MSRIQQRYVVNIAGALNNLRHGCRCHQVGTQRTEWRMFLLDPQPVVGQSPGPGDLVSRRGGGGAILPNGQNRFVCLRRKHPLCKL